LSDPKAVTIWSKVEGIDALAELALNLHWSWNHAEDKLWEALEPELSETTQNPWVLLQTVSKVKIQAALATQTFCKRLDDVLRQNRARLALPTELLPALTNYRPDWPT